MNPNNNYEFATRNLQWFKELIGVKCSIVIRRIGAESPMLTTKMFNPITNETDADLYHRHYKANNVEVKRSDVDEFC